MRLKSFLLAVALVMITLSSSVAIVSASSPSFHMEINRPEGQAGDEFEVVITGRQVEEVYGYEIELEYDASMLRFNKATSGISNMIYPIESTAKGTILLVSTKVGNVKGDSGEVMLANASFRVIGEGLETELKLNKVKLATSTTVSARHEVDQRIQIRLPDETNEKPDISFTDISGHWAENNIKRAVDLGFIQGYGDGTFRPDRQVSRAEFAVMIQGAFHYDENEAALFRFKDRNLMGNWAKPAISALAGAGIINGYDDSTFRPGKSILRSEMAVMMAAIMKLDVNPTERSSFGDASDMPAWAEPSIAAVAKEGLLQGRGSNLFKPNGLMTRAEAVQAIISMIDDRKLASADTEEAKAE